jgi:hypothetical protein
MDRKPLAARPSLEQYKKQAKELVKAVRAAPSSKSPSFEPSPRAIHDEAIRRIKKHHPRFAELPDDEIAGIKFALADAQFVIAREHGFQSWPKFAKQAEAAAQANFLASVSDPVAEFIVAACVPRDSRHASGTLDRAEAILAAYPEVARAGIHTAAILGDRAGVRRFLALDARNATARGGRMTGMRSRTCVSQGICDSTARGPTVSSRRRQRSWTRARTRTPGGWRRTMSRILSGRAQSMAQRDLRSTRS